MMSGSFGNPAQSRKVVTGIRASALRKLDIINAAATIEDLRSPPGNRLEQLNGDLEGFHSIRINQQWRLVFQWKNGRAEEVQIIDYHR